MNILTFDIEDWWVYDYYSIGKKTDWLPRLDYYLNTILDLLDERNVKATFFCLGKVAESNPEVIKKIANKGHHIGCHSFRHGFWSDATPKEVEEDTKKGLVILEDITGKKIDVYRAPAFSITEQTKWILEILAANGIKYDCSIFPASRSFGGFPNYKSDMPAIIRIGGIEIKEFPISVTTVLGKKTAYSGGGYFRLFPYNKLKSIIGNSDYVMTYFHIKDFDVKRPKLWRKFNDESAFSRFFKEYYGIKGCFNKFTMMVSDFPFMSVVQADQIIDWNTNIVDV